MILSSVEKIAFDIGFDIGMSNDEVQADLLNGFCKAISNSTQIHDRETQLCYIANKLDGRSMAVIKTLHEFIILKEENNNQRINNNANTSIQKQ